MRHRHVVKRLKKTKAAEKARKRGMPVWAHNLAALSGFRLIKRNTLKNERVMYNMVDGNRGFGGQIFAYVWANANMVILEHQIAKASERRAEMRHLAAKRARELAEIDERNIAMSVVIKQVLAELDEEKWQP